jgi:molybdopterin-guanine dinucleotide biosynthesis protein
MSIPIFLGNVLIVAGTGRNIGKTTLACQLIAHFSKQKEIFGLKITSIYPDEDAFHGLKSKALDGEFEITQEHLTNPNKDTYRMKQAGASKVFFIRTKDAYLNEALEALFTQIDKKSIIVCESASLRNFLQPGLFFMIRPTDELFIKERSRKLFPFADRIFISENINHTDIIQSIGLDEFGWKLLK